MGVASHCKDCLAERRKPGILAEKGRAVQMRAAELKACGMCREVKPHRDFGVRRASPDGRAHRCIECNKRYMKEYRERNPDAFRGWYAANKDGRAEYWQAWYGQNRERRSESYAAWAKANKHVVNALISKRRSAKLCATPIWADHSAIREIYKEAARLTAATGVKHEVDHIYPLQGETVCGLHCEGNLQILSKVDNIRKKNRMPEDAG